MSVSYWQVREHGRRLLAEETGTIRKDAENRVALLYPSPYRAAMSSLGYQTVYRLVNQQPGWAADRAVLPDDADGYRKDRRPLLTLEREQPVGNYRLLAFSVAYELEIAGLVACLDLAGVPALADEREIGDPLVVAGGPLTFSNPVPLAPFCDVIVLGEAEDLIMPLLEAGAATTTTSARAALLEEFAARPGYYVPMVHGERVPAIAAASSSRLPARSQIMTPNTELASMFLTEAARGCSRGCTYCVMRRSTNGGMRIVPVEDILAGIPEKAARVGLVGAAVTDHPHIAALVAALVEGGREIGISSLRADKLNNELVALLARGGYRTLTVASDGASEALRRSLERRTTEAQLLRCAELAQRHRLATVKIYMMVGVPGERLEDIDELARFTVELTRVHPRIALGVAPFVAKRHTPLDGAPFAGIPEIARRLARLRARLRGRAVVRPTSARWAWVEYMLAQGEARAGLACMDAYRAGGTFAAYKLAFQQRQCVPTGPRARVPSSAELIALRRSQREPRGPGLHI
jgi:radical SAM superfamily enzyme YgiQ (UPF0313 family)